MAHEAPSRGVAGVVDRIGDGVRYVLTMEPVAVAAVWRALVVLLGAAGFTVQADVDARVVAVIAAFYALVELITTLRARSRSVADARVVEVVDPGGKVVAGPASPIATGTVIRTTADDAAVLRQHASSSTSSTFDPLVDDVTFRPGATRRVPQQRDPQA